MAIGVRENLGTWARPGDATVVIERAEPGGRLQDLVITSTGLSQPAMVSLIRQVRSSTRST
jgi:hypothetical protein